MKKTFILLPFFFFPFCMMLHAQEKDTIVINKDSIERAVDEFLSMLDSANKPKSYLQVGVGISNTQFSINNVALNAQQVSKGFTLIPSLAYFHKSGLSLSYNNYISINNVNSGIVQHTITSAYDFSKEQLFDFGFSYTRFIGNKNFAESSSPYQNDFYSYLQLNKWKIQPSLSLGYSTGKFSEYTRTDTFAVLRRPSRPDTIINYSIFDTLRVKLRDFSSILSAQRQFVFETKKASNYITFTPSVLLFFARNAYDVEYSSASVLAPRTQLFLQSRPDLREKIISQIRTSFPDINQTRNFLNTTSFQIQSIGVTLDAVLYLKKFYINPQLYFDYYLQSSSDNFSFIYTIQTGFMF